MALKPNEKYGSWWLPNKNQNKISGSLTFKYGEHATLLLRGSFQEESFNGFETVFYEIIQGQIEGELFTLVNCLQIGFSNTLSGKGNWSKQTFQVAVIIKGRHFSTKNDLKFRCFNASYSHLREWAFHQIFKLKPPEKIAESENHWKKEPEKIEIRLENLTVTIEGTCKRLHSTYRDFSERDVRVHFFSILLELRDILKLIDDFQNFLELLLDENVTLLSIHVDEGEKFEIIIPTMMSKKEEKYPFRFYPQPINFKQFLDNPVIYLANWLSSIEKYRPMYDLYFGKPHERSYLTTKFLDYAQSLEAYHSRKFKTIFFEEICLMEIETRTNLQNIVKDLLPEPKQSAVLSRFDHINRKTLKMVMEEILEDNKQVLEVIEDRKKFIRNFVDTRNYYTHYSPEMEKNYLGYEKLLRLVENSRLILVTIFLKEIGFPEDIIKTAVSLYCRDKVIASFDL